MQSLPRHQGQGDPRLLANLLLTLPFLLFFYLQLAHHQMWRDELNAFGIASYSPTLRVLLHYVRYEGHPWLWYVLLWIVSRFTADPIGLKVLQGVIGTGIYLVLGLFSPFRRWEKVLLFLCFFVSFEYTVMSRMYGLLFLFALLYVRRRALYPHRLLGHALLLGLLASTDVMGLLLSFAFLIELLWSSIPRFAPPGSKPTLQPSARRWLPAANLYLALLTLSVLSLLPPHDQDLHHAGALFGFTSGRFHLLKALVGFTVVPYFPTLTGENGHFWGALDQVEVHTAFFTLCFPLVLAAYWFTLRRHTNLLLLTGSALLFLAGFSYLVYPGSLRHFGIVFVAFLCCLWLLRHAGQRIPWPGYALLALTAVGGVHAAIASRREPFSNAGATAAWIQHSPFAALPIAGIPDFTVIGVAEMLHRPIYMLSCECDEGFHVFSADRLQYHGYQLPARLQGAYERFGRRDLLFVNANPLTDSQAAELRQRGLTLTPLQQFTGATTWKEDFWIFLVSGAAQPAPTPSAAASASSPHKILTRASR